MALAIVLNFVGIYIENMRNATLLEIKKNIIKKATFESAIKMLFEWVPDWNFCV